MRRNLSPRPPHTGEGLNPADPSKLNSGRGVPQIFFPLVEEMAGRPEGVSPLVMIFESGEAA
jgi:hypothetical protein